MIWREITRFLNKAFVPDDSVVLDIACDRGDFIRNVRAREKWATDVRDVSTHLTPDIRFARSNGIDLNQVLPKAHFDVVFMSNYLEHLPSTDVVLQQLQVVRELVKPEGSMIVLQPNIRLVGGAYWDFIDHHAALTEKSLAEAAGLAGFRTRVLITRFLPYTTKSRLPQAPLLVRAYLAFRPLWLLMGKQSLYVGQRI
jgi:2-polyprenyl-3-methyl-5-hydroxy-6-metoxy-1,4-benzoquinol methylase